MHRLLTLIVGLSLTFIPMVVAAQVFGQNQIIVSPFGSNGWVVSTTTGNSTKLSASSTPFFANFFSGTGSANIFSILSSLTFGGVTGNSWDDFCTAITGGAGLCDGTDATGAGGSSAIATSTGETAGQLSYWTSTNGTPATLGKVATTTLTASSPLSLSQAISVLGASPSVLTLNTSGTWSGNAGTATALAANGSNCTAGQFPLGVDASGAVETCTDAWTEAENTSAAYLSAATAASTYVPLVRTLTVAGTPNQITSSAGAQDLSANRTVTLSFPNLVIFPSNASSTLFSTVYSSSTDQVIGRNFTFGGVTGNSWDDFCTTITGSASLCDGDDATGAGGGITTLGPAGQGQTGSTQTLATSTSAFNGLTSALTIVGNSNTQTFTPSLSGTLTVGGGGTGATSFTSSSLLYGAGTGALQSVATTSVACSGTVSCPGFTAIGAAPITITGSAATSAFEIATTSNIAVPQLAYFTQTGGRTTLGSVATGTLAATSPVTVTAGRSVIGGSGTIAWDFSVPNTWTGLQTFANSSTTLASFGYASSTQYFGAGLSACGTNSWLAWASGTFNCSSLDVTGDWTGTIDGNNFTGGAVAQGDILYGSGAGTIAELAKDTNATRYLSNQGASNNPSWNQINLTNGVTGTLPYGNGGTGTTTAPVGHLLYGGANAYQSVATSSATCTDASGVTCTTFTIVGSGGSTIALSSIPNSSLANSTISGISLGSNLNALTNDATLNGSSYNGSAAISDWGLNLANANSWTALQSFLNASTTLFSNTNTAWFGGTATSSFGSNGLLDLVDAAAPTFSAAGQIGWDSTSWNLLAATSTNNTPVVIASGTTTLYAYTATTSPIVSGTVMELPSHPLGQVATAIWCKVTSGTSLVINLSDGTNDTNAITCTTTGTQYALTSNNSWTAYERINVEYGTKTGTTGDVVVRVLGYRTSD